jgi:hypothetical protein
VEQFVKDVHDMMEVNVFTKDMFKAHIEKPNYEESLIRSVGDAKSQLVQWINQIWIDKSEEDCQKLVQKATWFINELKRLKSPSSRQLVQGLNIDMIDGSLKLHFLPIGTDLTIIDCTKPIGKGSYGYIFKCHINGVDFIPH